MMELYSLHAAACRLFVQTVEAFAFSGKHSAESLLLVGIIKQLLGLES